MATMTEREYRTADKDQWGDGPWQDEPDKIQFTDEATGLPCLVKRHDHAGHLCGYVGVAPGHPLFEVGYDQCPRHCSDDYCDHRPESVLNVHGGITYTDACRDGDEATSICHIPAPGEPDHVWWFGFDCAHAGDLGPEMAAWRKKRGDSDPRGDVYRTVDYVRGQCAELAGKLAAMR